MCESTRYYKITSSAASFTNSKSACEGMPGHSLALFKDQTTYDDVHFIVGKEDLFQNCLKGPFKDFSLASIIHYNAWTGLTNANYEYCENSGCTNELVWDDGENFDFSGASYAYTKGHVRTIFRQPF